MTTAFTKEYNQTVKRFEYQGWAVEVKDRNTQETSTWRYHASARKINWTPRSSEEMGQAQYGPRGWWYQLVDNWGILGTCGFANPDVPVEVIKQLIDYREAGIEWTLVRGRPVKK